MQSNSVLYFSNAEFRQKSYGTSNYLIIVDMDFTFCFPPQSYILGQLLTCSHQYGHTGPLWQQASTCLFCYLCFPPRQGECLCLSSFCDWHVGHASYQMLVFSLDVQALLTQNSMPPSAQVHVTRKTQRRISFVMTMIRNKWMNLLGIL